MINIHYPDIDFRFKIINKQRYIFDDVRRQYILLTPEEWVRQNFLHYLIKIKKYPAALMGVEKEIHLGALQKRCDIIMYERALKPWMIVECKASSIMLSRHVLDQILRYNMALPVSYLIITNGAQCMGYYRNDREVKVIQELPEWPSV